MHAYRSICLIALTFITQSLSTQRNVDRCCHRDVTVMPVSRSAPTVVAIALAALCLLTSIVSNAVPVTGKVYSRTLVTANGEPDGNPYWAGFDTDGSIGESIVAAAISWLVSSESSYTAGSYIEVSVGR